MACSVAVFSPSPLDHPHLAVPDVASPSPSSPSLRLRFQKGTHLLRSLKEDLDASRSTPSSSVLKRKRPARLDIPQTETLGFARETGVEVVEIDSGRFSVFCKKGRVREKMEDRFSAGVDIDGDSKLAFFGVFDGHGGSKAAEFVSKNLQKNVIDELPKISSDDRNGVMEAVSAGYLRTDSELLREEICGGSCSVTALIRDNDLIVSNVGDCRAVLSRGGNAEALTSDHKPSREDERNRIENLGGYVDFRRGTWRLQGSLAVSRGMGDAHLKQWVIAEPETQILKIEPECEFLILASDGLWDKVSNQEAVDIARPMCINSDKALVLSACKKLADLSASRGSLDDVSVMIIQLKHCS